jgi:phosphatidylglycerol---prolipoprotein diacylglyceryl transferase
MLPVLARFEIGGWEVVLPAYGTLLLLAAVVAGTLAVRAAGSPSVALSGRRATLLYGAAIAAGLVGARLLDVLLDPGPYLEEPSRIAETAPRGFALAGGLIGALAVAIPLARLWGVGAGALADSAIPATAAGIVLLRVGCFLNGCCPGEVTTLPWGVTFPYGSDAWGQQILSGQGGLLGLAGRVEPVHPAQLYEAAAAALCALAAWRVGKRPGVPAGTAALAFATGFLAFRVANQAIRPDAPGASLPHEALLAAYAAAAIGAGVLLAIRASATLRRGTTGQGA